MNDPIDPVLPQLANTLIENCPKLIQSLYIFFNKFVPRFELLQARKEREIAELKAISEENIQDIKLVRNIKRGQLAVALGQEGLSPDDDIVALALKCSSEAARYQNLRKWMNQAQIAQYALEELLVKKSNDKPIVEPDPDWAARFFHEAAFISKEEVQKVFGKILAGELNTPGSFSQKTLQILGNIDPETAKAFSNFCNFIINGRFIHEYAFRQIYNFDDLLLVMEAGLLDYHVGLNLTIEGQLQYGILDICGTRYIMKNDRPTLIPGAMLTKAGVQLSSIIEKVPQAEYVATVLNLFKRTGGKIFEAVDTGDGKNFEMGPEC